MLGLNKKLGLDGNCNDASLRDFKPRSDIARFEFLLG